ncbi:haloacid dehalogenase type II [Haloparvum sedimenti]|uniref:haloacid dehalogenase type II n=1 Tax=Haloparvum sedimenti TaxID=1678448 RepID=UPI00071E83AC|nr:haloacid dehalogenase type II [Haloparvum sedimenti]
MAAICFDMYGTLCDTSSVTGTLGRELDASAALVAEVDATWRRRQLEYSFQLSLMDEYRTFWEVTADALDYALARYGLDPDQETRERALSAYEDLTPYPGATDALSALREAGHTVAVLSNGNPEMLETLAENAGLASHLDEIISADAVETFKPAPAVYENAANELGEPLEECWLVTSNAWDAAGAGSAGMRTGWVNRNRDPHERIGPAATATARDLPGIVPEIR